MDIELRHLRYFIAVAEELHFGRAAQRLHLAQPPLSQQIRQLEERLGHALFTRTSRAVKLTAAGEVFLARARRTLRNLHDDIEEARSIGRGEEGLLRVGFIGSAMLTSLPKVFGTYRRKYPRVQFQIHESFSSTVARDVLSSVLDVGLLRDADPLEGLSVETIFSESYVAVLPRSHSLAVQKSISPVTLRGLPFVLHSPAASKRAFEKPMSICETHGFRPQIVQEAPQWFTLLRLVGANLGVTIAPQCVERIALDDVVCVRLRGVKTQSEIQLAYRSGENRALVRAFAAMVREGFGRRAK